MYEIKIYDLENKQRNGAKWETLEEAQAWLDKHLAKKRPFGWGHYELKLREEELNRYGYSVDDGFLSEVVEPGEGEIFEPYTLYTVPKNFTVEGPTDISGTPEYKEGKKREEIHKEVWPKFQEALMEKELNNNPSLLVDLKKKYKDINNRWK